MIQMQKLVGIYKNKFSQLKNAYDEVEREKEHVKVFRKRITLESSSILYDFRIFCKHIKIHQ